MNRYQSNLIFNRFDGKRVLSSTTYPPIEVSESDIYIIAGEGDYLDVLAQKYYSNSSFWWIIARANGIKSSFKVPNGMQLRIPRDIQSILSNFNSANS